MAQIVIVSSTVDPPLDVLAHSTEFLLKHSAELDRFKQHSLMDDPEKADLILFAEQGTAGKFVELVRAHPYYRRFPEKCFVFDDGDFCRPVVPGVYAALTQEDYRLGYCRTGFYFSLHENPFIGHRRHTGNEKFLASFVGSMRTHPVREELLKFNRDDIYVKATSAFNYEFTEHAKPQARASFWQEYADAMADARFSLCPRGRCASSIRLMESMKMGRPCVIISDAWQPNEHINWSEFSIRVPESEVYRIPEILDREQHRAEEMGERARQVWEEQFSEQARFHRVVELCLEIRSQTSNTSLTRCARLLRQVMSPRNFRWYLNSKKWLYRQTGKIYW